MSRRVKPITPTVASRAAKLSAACRVVFASVCAKATHSSFEPPPPHRSRTPTRARAPGARSYENTARRSAFLRAGRYTIADIALYAHTHSAGEGGFELASYPAGALMACPRPRTARLCADVARQPASTWLTLPLPWSAARIRHDLPTTSKKPLRCSARVGSGGA
jgi:hypothetical protein